MEQNSVGKYIWENQIKGEYTVLKVTKLEDFGVG